MIMEGMESLDPESLDPESLDNNRRHHHPKDGKG